MKTKLKIKSNKGFTLVEMMIVVAIIGAMVAFIGASVRQAAKSSRDKARETHMANLRTALVMYYEKNRDFPVDGATKIDDSNGGWGFLSTELDGYINMAEIKDPLGDPNYYYKYEYDDSGTKINCKLYYGSEKEKKHFGTTPKVMKCR
jgi:prepilin-type N-terminal cleavage/methylation domain-containing protein